jgi:hypothetical protein
VRPGLISSIRFWHFSTLARMSSPEAVHTKVLACSLCDQMNSMIFSIRPGIHSSQRSSSKSSETTASSRGQDGMRLPRMKSMTSSRDLAASKLAETTFHGETRPSAWVKMHSGVMPLKLPPRQESCPQEPAAPTSFISYSRSGTLWTTLLPTAVHPIRHPLKSLMCRKSVKFS